MNNAEEMLVRIWVNDGRRVWGNTKRIRLGEARPNDIGYQTSVIWQTSEGDIHNADVVGITGESGDFAHVEERLANQGGDNECWIKGLQRAILECLRT